MATEGTKFQVNFKTSDGSLINLYAATVQELETGLADLAMNASNIKATAAELGAGQSGVAYAAAALGGTPVAAAQGDSKVCKHGAMSFKTGTSAKGPWQGWMCAAPKGALDKCETIWVR
jgi:hypothetical protein